MKNSSRHSLSLTLCSASPYSDCTTKTSRERTLTSGRLLCSPSSKLALFVRAEGDAQVVGHRFPEFMRGVEREEAQVGRVHGGPFMGMRYAGLVPGLGRPGEKGLEPLRRLQWRCRRDLRLAPVAPGDAARVRPGDRRQARHPAARSRCGTARRQHHRARHLPGPQPRSAARPARPGRADRVFRSSFCRDRSRSTRACAPTSTRRPAAAPARWWTGTWRAGTGCGRWSPLSATTSTRRAVELARSCGLAEDGMQALRDLGQGINYNAYGETEADLLIAPAQLYRAIRPYRRSVRLHRARRHRPHAHRMPAPGHGARQRHRSRVPAARRHRACAARRRMGAPGPGRVRERAGGALAAPGSCGAVRARHRATTA